MAVMSLILACIVRQKMGIDVTAKSAATRPNVQLLVTRQPGSAAAASAPARSSDEDSASDSDAEAGTAAVAFSVVPLGRPTPAPAPLPVKCVVLVIIFIVLFLTTNPARFSLCRGYICIYLKTP